MRAKKSRRQIILIKDSKQNINIAFAGTNTDESIAKNKDSRRDYDT